MHWLPAEGMWFSYMKLREEASDLTYDLAMNVNGGQPSPVDAGFRGISIGESGSAWPVAAILGGLGLVALALGVRRRALAS
jgi:MYXO-CTERM domain-containing protein